MSNINKKLLNLERVDSRHQDNNLNQEQLMRSFKSDVQNINNISGRFRYVKYLGKGNQGYLHLLSDTKGNKFICKKIAMMSLQPNDANQLNFELAILKYLSSNSSVKPYINPCVRSKILEGNIYTIFPVINAISLVEFKKYLNKLNEQMYYKIVKKMFRNILHAVGAIHHTNIAHQNIDPSSMLISMLPEDDIGIKFTDFGLGCGTYHSIIGKNDSYNVKNNNILSKKCGFEISNNTIQVNKSDLERLGHSKFLKKAQKLDCWNIGLILFELLLPGYLQRVHQEKGIDLSEYTKQFDTILSDVLDTYNLNDDDHEYLLYLFKYLLVESKKRKSCKYVLDKLITAMKYEY